jgi:hypothetical protein
MPTGKSTKVWFFGMVQLLKGFGSPKLKRLSSQKVAATSASPGDGKRHVLQGLYLHGDAVLFGVVLPMRR